MDDRKGYIYRDSYGDDYTVYPEIDVYYEGSNIYVGLNAFDPDINAIDFYGDVTVNVPGYSLPYLESAIDTNNNGQAMIDFLASNGFGEPTGLMLPSGFCMYPVFRFNEERLREIDPFVFGEYAKIHGRQPKAVLDAQISAADAKRQRQQTCSPEREPDHTQEH